MAALTSDDGSSGGAPGRERPRAMRAAGVALVLVEAALLLGIAAWWIVAMLRGEATGGTALFLVVFVLGVAAVLALAARALWNGRRGARGPLITWQLLQAATAAALFPVPGVKVWVVLALVLSGVVVVILLVPGVVAIRSGPTPTTPPEAQ